MIASGRNSSINCTDTRAVSNVELMMNKPSHFLDQPLLVEASVALRPEDHRSLIIVDSVNLETPAYRSTHKPQSQ